jgi:hypothetical protein
MLRYITFNTIPEMLCFLIAAFCMSGNINGVWRLSIPYLFVTCITEFTGIYLKSLHHPNQWPYNILLLFQILFNGVLFTHIYRQYLKNVIIVYVGLAGLFIIYSYEISTHGFLTFNMLTYNTMSVIFTIYALYYFYIILNDNNYLTIKSSATFWWVYGILFFYFGSTVVNLFRGKLTILFATGHYLTYYIYGALNIVLYGLWGYSFICRKWLTTLKA